ncbi:hypothetical protein J6590_024568 [Homalodisca vitripennis]|nr:hypothetical protein J6590_024568 [Homalodisca vitripennis]
MDRGLDGCATVSLTLTARLCRRCHVRLTNYCECTGGRQTLSGVLLHRCLLSLSPPTGCVKGAKKGSVGGAQNRNSNSIHLPLQCRPVRPSHCSESQENWHSYVFSTPYPRVPKSTLKMLTVKVWLGSSPSNNVEFSHLLPRHLLVNSLRVDVFGPES